jgi:hypothetical protein
VQTPDAGDVRHGFDVKGEKGRQSGNTPVLR